MKKKSFDLGKMAHEFLDGLMKQRIKTARDRIKLKNGTPEMEASFKLSSIQDAASRAAWGKYLEIAGVNCQKETLDPADETSLPYESKTIPFENDITD